MFSPTQNLKIHIALGSTDKKDCFQWPKSKNEILPIAAKELSWLMDGLSIHQEKAHKPLKYSVVF
jgi:hypothetical protein